MLHWQVNRWATRPPYALRREVTSEVSPDLLRERHGKRDAAGTAAILLCRQLRSWASSSQAALRARPAFLPASRTQARRS